MAASVADSGIILHLILTRHKFTVYTAWVPDCMTVWQNVNVCMYGMTASWEYWNSKRGPTAPPPPLTPRFFSSKSYIIAPKANQLSLKLESFLEEIFKF